MFTREEIRKLAREEIEKYSSDHHEAAVSQIREIANEEIEDFWLIDADESEIDPEFVDEFGPVVTHFLCPECGELIAIEDAELFAKVEAPEGDVKYQLGDIVRITQGCCAGEEFEIQTISIDRSGTWYSKDGTRKYSVDFLEKV